jgi:hypothetical protein
MTMLRYWADDPWWLSAEYAKVYCERLSPDDVDRTIRRVALTFDRKWHEKTSPYEVHYWLQSKGLKPLEYLYGLGKNLMVLEGCLRLPSVLKDLRQPGNYESATLELEIAALLKRAGHEVEFRPSLPNGRSSDFVIRSLDQVVYFEVKKLKESDRQKAISELGTMVASTLTSLTNNPAQPQLQGKHYEIVIDATVFFSLGRGFEPDNQTIEQVRQTIEQQIILNPEGNLPIEFVIPSIASVKITNGPQEGSTVLYPMASPDMELGRILRNHFMDAVEQLHPAHPGIIIVQTPAELEKGLSHEVIANLLVQIGPKAHRLSSVLFLPTFNWMPQPWSLFKPFAVCNRAARIPAESLAVFSDLRSFLEAPVKIPADIQKE